MKNILKNLISSKLVWQITIAFSVFMLIPATVITIAYYNAFKASLLEDANINLNKKLASVSQNISVNLDSIDAMLSQLVFTQEFEYFLNDESEISTREKNYYLYQAQAELMNIKYAYPNLFQHISIFSSNKDTVLNYGWAFNIGELAYREYNSEIFSNNNQKIYGNIRYQNYGSTSVSKLPNIADRYNMIFPTYYKIYSLNSNKCIGIIEVDILLTKFINGNFEEPKNSKEKIFVFNHNNQLIYKSDNSLADAFSIIDIKDHAGIRNIKTKNGEYIFAYKRDIQTRLLQAVAINVNDILEPANKMRAPLIFIAILSILLIATFTNILSRVMLKRLKDIDKMIVNIEEGNFDVRVKENGFNEISRIAKSFNRMASRLKNVMHSMVEKEKSQKDAELRALQAQINPHFLYNTLENMRMQCEIDEYFVVGDSLAALGDLLRYSINWDTPAVTLKQELKNLNNYIAIIEMRFKNKITFNLNIDHSLDDILIPKIILQPLLENCFKHAFYNITKQWIVAIDIYKLNNKLIIIVADNGAGITEERLAEINEHFKNCVPLKNNEKQQISIGLLNVKQRLNLTCPIGSELIIESEYGNGTKIIIEIAL